MCYSLVLLLIAYTIPYEAPAATVPRAKVMRALTTLSLTVPPISHDLTTPNVKRMTLVMPIETKSALVVLLVKMKYGIRGKRPPVRVLSVELIL